MTWRLEITRESKLKAIALRRMNKINKRKKLTRTLSRIVHCIMKVKSQSAIKLTLKEFPFSLLTEIL